MTHARARDFSPLASTLMLLFGIVGFVGGETLAVCGIFTGMVAIYPPFAPVHLALSLLAVVSGVLLAALGGVLMPYASDRMHDPRRARARRPLTGYCDALWMILVDRKSVV